MTDKNNLERIAILKHEVDCLINMLGEKNKEFLKLHFRKDEYQKFLKKVSTNGLY
jgi:hypothetical protein